MPVNKKRVVDEFTKMVSFDSESYHERKIADYILSQLRHLGIEAREDEAFEILAGEKIIDKNPENAGNIFARIPATGAGEPILFSAHMDTVKPGIGKKVLIHDDGKITSEGDTVLGADDVGGLVAILEMLRVFKEDNIPHPEIEVLFPIAEEPYGQGSREFDYANVKSKTAFVLDLSGPLGRAAFAAPTIISLLIKVKGKSAHAGFCPQDGIHAIAIAAQAISSLKNGWASDNTTLNIGTIKGGTQRNSVPEYVEITGEVRSLVHEEALKQVELVKKAFEDAAAAYKGQAEVEATIQIKSYRTPENSVAVNRFKKACLKTLSVDGELVETYGGSDQNNFAGYGIEGLVVASAMHEVHTTNEYTCVDELVKVAELTTWLGRSEID
ncbi:M20/M25/M40 family metallo-hydrolase [Butyrivibrio sp.]|uniref:M20/M25/M40 family metallo-hydrolase n=1 Tax=Butyrivibrio sp. TaxID=28121 RepID=UPI0025BA0159|nr:M20/M25/M40 family metallo-hydrolase [Butyrivibrio sp.]MBQ9306141.1 M20/M25/M40 family metallo-hydrolase [Butyrivibrio sp.]